MREIKFRAWDKRNKRMLHWGSGIISINHQLGIDGISANFYWAKDAILMQFTGLKDKDGVEIYEGDIVQTYHSEHIKGELCQIKYLGRSFCMAWDKSDTEMDCIWFYISEVVGNIYENPELLETP